jgi:type I restriction enzyme M protein
MNMKNDSEVSLFEKGIQRGIENGHISLSDDSGEITYRGSKDYTTGFKNPEEKVRASYFAELVLDYMYPTKGLILKLRSQDELLGTGRTSLFRMMIS